MSIHTAFDNTNSKFLTGVAWTDAVTADNFYTIGEGIGGATITAVRTSDQAQFSVTTYATGGYSLRLASGTYNVTASGPGFAQPVVMNGVVIGSGNVKRDFKGVVAELPGDANGDRSVDVSDLGILASNYGRTSGVNFATGDFNRDGRVDVSDLGILASNYGRSLLVVNAQPAVRLNAGSPPAPVAPRASTTAVGSATDGTPPAAARCQAPGPQRGREQ